MRWEGVRWFDAKFVGRIEELLETGPDFNMCIMGALQEGQLNVALLKRMWLLVTWSDSEYQAGFSMIFDHLDRLWQRKTRCFWILLASLENRTWWLLTFRVSFWWLVATWSLNCDWNVKYDTLCVISSYFRLAKEAPQPFCSILGCTYSIQWSFWYRS